MPPLYFFVLNVPNSIQSRIFIFYRLLNIKVLYLKELVNVFVPKDIKNEEATKYDIIKVTSFECHIWSQVEILTFDSKKKYFEDSNMIIRVPNDCAYRIKMSSDDKFKFLVINEKTKESEKPYICRFFDNKNIYTFGTDESDWCALRFFRLDESTIKSRINIEIVRIITSGTKLDANMNKWFGSVLKELKEK